MEYQETLKRVQFFRGASAEDIEALAAIVEPQELIGGQCIFKSGDAADAMFIIVMGTVEITVPGKQARFGTLGSDQMFGLVPFFQDELDERRRVTTATAHEITRALRIPFDRLTRLLRERPALALLVYRNACASFTRHLVQLSAELEHPYL